MTRAVIVAAAVIATTATLAPTATAVDRLTWDERFERVKYRSLEGSDERYSHDELELAARAAALHFGTPLHYLRCIIDRESGWGVHANNPTSTAGGLLQFLKSTWEAVLPIYRASVDRPNLEVKSTAGRYNPRPVLIVGAWLMRSGYSSHWGACG
jgi:hypothetical protein